MTIPMWMLLGFAAWTVALLLFTVGIYRWSRILTGRVPIREFRADRIEGDDWYRRAMRAHANCIENLPVFGAIVLAILSVWLGARLVRRWRSATGAGERAGLGFAATCLAVIALHSGVDYPLRSMALATLAGFSAGLILAPPWGRRGEPAELAGIDPE